MKVLVTGAAGSIGSWYQDIQDWWRTAKVVAESRYDRIGR